MRRDLMLKFKCTQDDEDFTAVINEPEYNKFIKVICRRKIEVCPTIMYSIDDLVNIAYFQTWKAINDYKFICPLCRIRCFEEDDFEKHILKMHNNKDLRPKREIDSHVAYNVGVYIQNAIRNEYSFSRKTNIGTVNLFSIVEDIDDIKQDKLKNEAFLLGLDNCTFIKENDIVFKLLMSNILNKFDSISRKIFELYIFDNLPQVAIAEYLLKIGRYSTKESATTTVSRRLKEIFSVIAKIYQK